MNNEHIQDYVQFRCSRHEFINALTHFLGFLFATAAGPLLIALAVMRGVHEIPAYCIYAASLVILYLVSTLYHAVPDGEIKQRLQALDHMAVFVLIAGTYTPFFLAGLGGALGWSLCLMLWLLAGVGIVFKARYAGRFDLVSTIAYVLLGWSGLVAIVPLYQALPEASFLLVLAGGVLYTVGAIFYRWESLPHNHAIWHVLCLSGSVAHFIAVCFLLV